MDEPLNLTRLFAFAVEFSSNINKSGKTCVFEVLTFDWPKWNYQIFCSCDDISLAAASFVLIQRQQSKRNKKTADVQNASRQQQSLSNINCAIQNIDSEKKGTWLEKVDSFRAREM